MREEAAVSQVLSVVVPVYNESEVLATFHGRLMAVMDEIGQPYQVIVEGRQYFRPPCQSSH